MEINDIYRICKEYNIKIVKCGLLQENDDFMITEENDDFMITENYPVFRIWKNDSFIYWDGIGPKGKDIQIKDVTEKDIKRLITETAKNLKLQSIKSKKNEIEKDFSC